MFIVPVVATEHVYCTELGPIKDSADISINEYLKLVNFTKHPKQYNELWNTLTGSCNIVKISQVLHWINCAVV